MNKIREYFSYLGLRSRYIFIAITATIFTLQTTTLVYYASQSVDSQPIVAAFDNDASNAINVAGRSYPIVDNGFASYGPVYFRIANTLSWVLPDLSAPGALPHAEARTKTWNFALVLTSIIAVQTLSLGLASLLTSQLFLIFLFAAGLSRVMLSLEPWQDMLLRAHPDHTLTLLTALATFLTIRYWQQPQEEKPYRTSAWAWGVAFATKLSLVLYTPFIVLGVLWSSRSVKRAAIYVGHMLIAYFVVGFIQNFNVPRTLRFLSYQSQYSESATLGSVLDWLQIYGPQAQYMLGFGLLLVIWSWMGGSKQERPTPRVLALSAGLFFGPFLLILLQKVTTVHTHYTIPILATQLTILFTLGARKVNQLPEIRKWGLALAGLALFCVFKTTPDSMGAWLQSQAKCRPEAREVYTRIQDLQAKGLLIYVDQYVPVLDKTPGFFSTWKPSKDFIKTQDFKVMVLHMGRAQAYLQPKAESSNYIKNFNPEIQKSTDFYSLFNKQDRVSDADIGSWERTYKNDCSWEIWERR
ncbi:MAG: glycosyltransferase family 39 protein [Bdellovibrionales bacterium]|nr:glycosyltransferase family 39 protein [Bdellovibrionales bacterium]